MSSPDMGLSYGDPAERIRDAAPDLLSALERIVPEYLALCGATWPDFDMKIGNEDLVAEAKAAIARALGTGEVG